MRRALIDSAIAAALSFASWLAWRLRDAYIWAHYGRITSADKSMDGGVVSEVAYYGRRGRMVGYWAYGYYDPAMPYKGDPSMKRIIMEFLVVLAIAAGACVAAFLT